MIQFVKFMLLFKVTFFLCSCGRLILFLCRNSSEFYIYNYVNIKDSVNLILHSGSELKQSKGVINNKILIELNTKVHYNANSLLNSVWH